MRRILTCVTVTVASLFVAVVSVEATDDPHGSANSINCGKCHIAHGTLGDILINATDSLVSTLCLSCHTPGGWVNMTKVMSSSQKASPGVSGTSHAWDVTATNSLRGAQTPQSAVLLDHLTASGKVTCATCHDPHKNTTPPFLRLDNSADALCLDCHRSRNLNSVRTYTGSTLSHPVGIALPSTSTYHNPPLDVNGSPQPSDGNTTNDLTLLAGGAVSCTSCHGVHYKDSNSGTVDQP
ncbi:MAG TPA: cytochrome c3 family protein [Candidatus Deferrimicrobium sp.]|nr:cytochrome c3 family protein [Candidatus Deferrimicrobium sp.]